VKPEKPGRLVGDYVYKFTAVWLATIDSNPRLPREAWSPDRTYARLQEDDFHGPVRP